MKIYNEVVTTFNELTGQWETISEDSFEYSGQVALAQGGLPPNATAINTSDTIADTIKTTTGYFTGGDGTIGGTDIFTQSLSAKNSKYYENVMQKDPNTDTTAAVQFSVTFGHAEGSGSDTTGDSSGNNKTLKGETQAIYKQLAGLLMEETEASGGFKIASKGSDRANGTIGVNARDDYVWALVGKRQNFKDRLNKKSWTLTLSASNTAGAGVDPLYLTDDSQTVAAVATPGGPRYNIVSGALGTATVDASTKTFGWYYPEMGCMVFSGAQLSASLPGGCDGTSVATKPTFEPSTGTDAMVSSSGFAPFLTSTQNGNNALKFINSMRNMSGSTSLRLRSEEDQTQENYFCRVRATDYNFSSNPTFTSGSKNKIRNTDMHGNPQTFITGVGLYNSSGQLLAIAKLSSPLKKNFASEATIKVKLTY